MRATRMMAGVAVLAMAGGAAAASKAPTPPGVKQLLACRALPGAAERLACFDREAASLGGELDKGHVVVVDKAEVRAAQRARFGLAAPGLELFAGKDGQPLARINTSVGSAFADPFNRLVITLVDGSRWLQVDDYPLSHLPRAGEPVTISRAAVGSFKMTIAGQAAIRVRRDR